MYEFCKKLLGIFLVEKEGRKQKEDAFIARVLDAVRHSAPSLPASQEVKAENDENVEAMFAFLDGFE